MNEANDVEAEEIVNQTAHRDALAERSRGLRQQRLADHEGDDEGTDPRDGSQRDSDPSEGPDRLVLPTRPRSVGDAVADQPATDEADHEQAKRELEWFAEHAVDDACADRGGNAVCDSTRCRGSVHTR